ncbi:unnamed protein product [Amoebophrya sp. A120]|nr:unnamed protein product [Amoebophrya sp. A120]|eukprot:GSA120T00005290001.1
MERELFRALRDSSAVRPSAKEVKEALAFCNAVKPLFPKVKVVLDVAGGHGALAAVFLILHRSVERAVVIDPFEAPAGKRGILTAWGKYLSRRREDHENYIKERLRTAVAASIEEQDEKTASRSTTAPDAVATTPTALQPPDGEELVCQAVTEDSAKESAGSDHDQHPDCALRYRHEDLHTGLPDELATLLNKHTTEDDFAVHPSEILVVACHACQHLTDDTIDIAQSFGVHVAVMPCCHRDRTQGQRWKSTARHLADTFLGEQSGMMGEGGKSEDKKVRRTKNDQLFGTVTDLLTAGRMQVGGKSAGVRYDVRMRFINENITPQNRILVGTALSLAEEESSTMADTKKRQHAERQLSAAYRAAHKSKASVKERP